MSYYPLEHSLVDDYVERFAEADPYVRHGLVTAWSVRPWTVVVGTAADPA